MGGSYISCSYKALKKTLFGKGKKSESRSDETCVEFDEEAMTTIQLVSQVKFYRRY